MLTGINIQDFPDVAQILEKQFGYKQPSPPATIPYDTFLSILEQLKRQVFPNRSQDEAYEMFGRAILHGFVSGPIGEITKMSSKLLGPVRGARFIVKNASSTFPFGRHELEEVRDGYFRYHYYDIPGNPALVRGLIRAAFDLSAVSNLQVTSIVLSPEEALFEATW